MTAHAPQSVFQALDKTGSGFVPVQDIVGRLNVAGFRSDDPRLAGTLDQLYGLGDLVNPDEFENLTYPGHTLIERIVREELVIPQFGEFTERLKEIYDITAANKSGQVASYIPQLARVDPDQFAVAICTIDGQRAVIGDTDVPFTFQSSSKPFLYSAALENLGEERVHQHVGREPSGQTFNELTLNKIGLPHNPMINAGAIMSASLILPGLPMAERFEAFTKLLTRISGGQRPGFNNAIYHSERETADRNFALAHYMREVGAFPKETDIFKTLDFYFAVCSIETTARDMATAAATFANGGVVPQTGTRVFRNDTVKHCLSMMYSCGMYDYSGEFAFRVGIPAKSSVSGVIMAVIPNVMGMVIWSPRIDETGNSVRAVEFLERVVATFNFHNYDSLVETRKIDPRRRRQTTDLNATFSAIHAASTGDVDSLQRLVAYGHSLDCEDYDGRTPLHLAAAEGHADVVKYLCSQGVSYKPEDRWGNTPLDDAIRHEHASVVELLSGGEGCSELCCQAAE